MSTLDDLYSTFSKYTPVDLACCACCHEPKFVDDLKSIPLASLGSYDLYDYFSSALYTCEGVWAFKYFLPRLFELFPDELWQFQAKLDYIQWEDWDIKEINVIKKHVFFLWMSGHWPCSFSDYYSFFSFEEIFEFWSTDDHFLRESLPFVTDFKFKTLREKKRTHDLIEDKFFEIEDEKFAEELSVAATYVLCLPPWGN